MLSFAIAPAAAEPTADQIDDSNALVRRVRAELRSFTQWLEANNAGGFVGEVGWPRDDARWNKLAEEWFRDADRAGLGVTVWATGEWWGKDYRLGVYSDSLPGTGVDTASRGAEVLESYLPSHGVLRGVNVAGAEFGAPSVGNSDGFSNETPGEPGEDYHYSSQATFEYLARRGVNVVRMPFRWERLQRSPGQPLDPAELGRLSEAVERAGSAGLDVILDLHNYGAYYLAGDAGVVRRPVGSAEVTIEHFAEMWGRISNHFAGTPTVVAYGLMNEPVGIDGADGLSPAEVWEKATQAALDRIRGNGDRKLVLVPGHEWSGVQTWRRNHPDAWIDDPADRFMYEAHHYFDGDYSGTYDHTFAEEALVSARGSARVEVRSGPSP